MLRKVAMIGLLVMATAATARAGLPETPRLRQLTVGDGLPSNMVHALAEDRSGHLWIGTGDGLARFDGVGFRVWRREDGLPANEIADLYVDADDRLWIGTTGGMAMLDRERAGFRIYDAASVPGIGSDLVWNVAGTDDGAVWFGTANAGLHRIGPDGGVRRFMPDPGDPRSLPAAGVPLLETGPDGTLWVGTRGGVARWTGEDFDPVRGLPADPILLGLVAADDGRLWVGLPQGLGVVGDDGGFAQTLPWVEDDAPGRLYNLLLRDRNGHYWLEARGGLAMAVDGRVEAVRTYSDLRQGPVTPAWTAAHEDREGGLWLGSLDAGLWYLAPNWRQFSVLLHSPDDPESPGNVDVTAIAPAADGSMWLVGNSGVLDRLDPDSGEVEHVYRDAEDYVPSHVLEDDAGSVWTCFHGGLGRYDRRAGDMRLWYADDAVDPAPAEDCAALVQAAGGLIWSVSGFHGLQARGRDGTVRESITPGDGRGLDAQVRLVHAERAPDGGLWVSGEPGLLMWNAGTRALEPVPGAPDGPIGAFALQGRDRVWITRPGVLESYRWDGARLSAESGLGTTEGIPLLDFGGLAVDAEGVVWLGSARGLVRVDPARRMVNVFGVSHGLPAQDISTPPVARPSDGRMHLSTGAGLVIFDPASVRPDEGTPGLAIKTVEVRGRDGVRQLDLSSPLRLGWRDHEMRVQARLDGFNAARHNRYRFRLHGYDSDWVETDASGQRVFPALAPGRYRLEAMGRTALSGWSEPTTFAFEVAGPWWRTGNALAAYAVVALLLGGWMVHAVRGRVRRRMALQRVQDERELARQASDAKTRFLATLGHEVRTPMTGVLGMSELLLRTPLDARQRGYTESIRRAGDHLMRLVNDALDLARIEAGRLELDPQPFDPRALVEEVGALMAPLAQRRGLAYRMEVSAELAPGLRGDAVRVRQILLNLLGNAIKFTERGSVGLQVQALAPAGVRFIVADTGPGLNAEQKSRLFRRFEQAEGARTASRYGGSGLGLAICQELAAEMEGRIQVDSKPGEGTRFVVELPLPHAELPGRGQPVSAAQVPGVRVLLVEDDPTVAEVITGLLAGQGCTPTRVGHGLAALAEAQRGRFDLALLDLDLPGIDGIALAMQLRAQGWDRPLVALTARADAAAEPLARQAGFDAFLRKPVSGEALAQAIAGVLEGAGALPLCSRVERRVEADGSDGEEAAGGVACAGTVGDVDGARDR